MATASTSRACSTSSPRRSRSSSTAAIPPPSSGRDAQPSTACWPPSTARSSRTSGATTRPSAGSTSSSTARTSARRCATRARRRATAASWPSATSSSRRATSCSSSWTTRSAARGCEMHGEGTKLEAQLRVLRPPHRRAARAPGRRKDPRDLRILDPACGSGHFLLYAFDLLAPDLRGSVGAAGTAACERAHRAHAPGGLPDARPAPPGAAVAHRRAQPPRRGHRRPVCADRRPGALAARAARVQGPRDRRRASGLQSAGPTSWSRSPCPGTATLAAAFADELPLPFQQALFSRMVQEMRLAGDLGTLLQAERLLAGDISKARRQFVARAGDAVPRGSAQERARAARPLGRDRRHRLRGRRGGDPGRPAPVRRLGRRRGCTKARSSRAMPRRASRSSTSFGRASMSC